MPIYEYECTSCGDRKEVLQRISEEPLTTCRECGGKVRKLISAPAFQFKGTGWYVTDYGDKRAPKGEEKAAKGTDGGSAEAAGAADGNKGKTEKSPAGKEPASA